MSDLKIPVGWENVWNNFKKSTKNYEDLDEFLIGEQKKYYEELDIYPQKENIFKAFYLVKPENLKVVIIGQDPYHQPFQATGLSFSVPQNVPIPPSLKTIFKNLTTNCGIKYPKNGDLTLWANQGVLLLNNTLTVRHGRAGSHSGKWDVFINMIIEWINEKLENIVFIMWGKEAQEKEYLIYSGRHLILKGIHPSPLSNRSGGEHPFIKLNHFNECNEYLKAHNKEQINWEL